jgi:hypothetical protein
MSCQSLPQEMTDAIIDNLHDDSESLMACSTVCKVWTVPARRHLFESVSTCSKDIARFLISGRAIIPFIRHFELEDFQTRGLKKWNDHLPLLAKEHFDCVQSLTLSIFLWNRTIPEAKRTILTQFTGIVCLRLSEVDVGGFSDLTHLISAFPYLESLALDYVKWVDADSPRQPRFFPHNLHTLETRASGAGLILEWLLSSENVPPLHTLYIHHDATIPSNVLDKLLPVLSSSLKKFQICFDGMLLSFCFVSCPTQPLQRLRAQSA